MADKNSKTSKTEQAPATPATPVVNSRSKIDALFANSPAKVRVKAADDGRVYSAVVGSSLVGQFSAAGQDDAFTALGLAHADTLKRSSKNFDANANAVSLTQDAIAK